MEVSLEGQKQGETIHGGVQGESGATDVGGGTGVSPQPGSEDQANGAVSLAGCVSEGGPGRVTAPGATAANPEGRDARGGGAPSRIGAQGGAAGDGDGFFAKSLQACQGVTSGEQRAWRNGIYGEIEAMMQLAGSVLSIEEACRAGFYRFFDEHTPRQAETELRDRIQRVALENRFYGYRRVAAELRLQGVVINHKRVLRVMREDNLLSLRKRRFVVTTDSRHYRPIYPNLLVGRPITGLNQVWVADITYIHLREEFIFLAVILDAFSRRVVGWELGESLQATLALQALNRALADRPVPAGIIHHSDQGIQYASAG